MKNSVYCPGQYINLKPNCNCGNKIGYGCDDFIFPDCGCPPPPYSPIFPPNPPPFCPCPPQHNECNHHFPAKNNNTLCYLALLLLLSQNR